MAASSCEFKLVTIRHCTQVDANLSNLPLPFAHLCQDVNQLGCACTLATAERQSYDEKKRWRPVGADVRLVGGINLLQPRRQYRWSAERFPRESQPIGRPLLTPAVSCQSGARCQIQSCDLFTWYKALESGRIESTRLDSSEQGDTWEARTFGVPRARGSARSMAAVSCQQTRRVPIECYLMQDRLRPLLER